MRLIVVHSTHSLTCYVFHLLDNLDDVQKLKSKLFQAKIDLDNVSIAQVDNLSFLDVVIQETVRLHLDVMTRQARMFSKKSINYENPHTQKQYVVSPNTMTSMSSLDIYMHSKVFDANAYEFRSQS